MKKALPIAIKTKDSLAIARINNDLCLNYILEGNHLLMAEEYCKNARKIANQNKYGLEIAHNERNMAQLWYILGNIYVTCYHIKIANEKLKYLQ